MTSTGESSNRPHVAVLAPVFNDWDCVPYFLADLSDVSDRIGDVSVLLVDDGSTEERIPSLDSLAPAIGRVEVLRLGCNLGHQRAIAVGIVELASRPGIDAIVVIDADGEDRPQDAETLWREHLAHPDAIIVAQRRQRFEAAKFRIFYRLYKVLFRLLTGRDLDFGNFSVIPTPVPARLALMTELWNHYPATLMRSRVPLIRVPIDRSTRYSGQSRMNFTALVNHGLAGIAAFIDTAFARLLVLAAGLTVVLGLVAVGGIVLRLITEVPIPGWAALGATVALIGLFQVIAALVVLSFLTLSNRSTSSPPPAKTAGTYVADVTRLR